MTVSTWKKSTARIAWACARRNCRQVGPDRRGAGSMPAPFRIFQTVEAPIVVAEADELAVDASVAPGRVLAGHPQHQGADAAAGWVGGRLPSRVGPAAGDQLGVPAQQGAWGDQPELAQLRGQQPAQCAEERAVDPGRVSGVGCVGVARRPRGGGPGSRRPWLRRSGRAAPASSARGRTSGTRVEGPRRAILLGGLRAVTARSAGGEGPDQRP